MQTIHDPKPSYGLSARLLRRAFIPFAGAFALLVLAVACT